MPMHCPCSRQLKALVQIHRDWLMGGGGVAMISQRWRHTCWCARAKAHAYLIGSLISSTLECWCIRGKGMCIPKWQPGWPNPGAQVRIPNLKGRAMDPMSAKKSPRTQDIGEHPKYTRTSQPTRRHHTTPLHPHFFSDFSTFSAFSQFYCTFRLQQTSIIGNSQGFQFMQFPQFSVSWLSMGPVPTLWCLVSRPRLSALPVHQWCLAY